jgi:hypothetical protein
MKDRAKQSSSSWYQSARLITVQSEVVVVRLIVDLLDKEVVIDCWCCGEVHRLDFQGGDGWSSCGTDGIVSVRCDLVFTSHF